jgi:hypothetical protein
LLAGENREILLGMPEHPVYSSAEPIGFSLGQEVPADPADHALEFAHRYAEDLDIIAGQVMLDLGISDNQIGARDPERGGEHHSFFPGESSGGSISPSGQITVNSAVLNPIVMDGPYGEECGQLWRRSRLADHIQAIIAHERAEDEYGDHELARIAAPETMLPISQRARMILRAMESGWSGS